MSSQTKIIKDILSTYNTILENKLYEVADVYPNVDFVDRGESHPSTDDINTALLDDIQNAAEIANVKIDITTAISGHHSLPSRHPSGNAIDITHINGKHVSLKNRDDADKFVDALVSMGYVKNQEGSNPKAVLTFGFPDHNDHVHVSNTTGKSSTPTEKTDTETDKSKDDNEVNVVSVNSEVESDPLIRSFGNYLYKSLGFDKKVQENVKKIKKLL